MCISDLNASVDSPETSTSTLSNSGSPSQATSLDDTTMNFQTASLGPYQQMQVSCGSNFSTGESDPGYESASPYTNYQSPTGMVSPGACSDATAYSCMDYEGVFIRGQNCSMASVYSPSPSVHSMASSGMDSNGSGMFDDNCDFSKTDNYLDQILQQLNNKAAMDNIYSTIENFVTTNDVSISTNVGSPGMIPGNSQQQHHQQQQQHHHQQQQQQQHHQQQQAHPPQQQARPVKSPHPAGNQQLSPRSALAKSNSFLRDALTMPEKELNNISKFSNGSKRCQKRGFHSTNPNSFSVKQLQSAQNQNQTPKFAGRSSDTGNNNMFNVESSVRRRSPTESCQSVKGGEAEGLDVQASFPGIPDDISDFAMQYLDNLMDTQAQSVINELQGDNFMDTMSQGAFLGSSSPCGLPGDMGSNPSSSSEQFTSPYSGSQCQGGFQSPSMCEDGQRQSVNVNDSYLKLNGSLPGDGVSLNSQDHPYHQSLGRGLNPSQHNNSPHSRSRSQKIPDPSVSNFYSTGVTPGFSSATTQTQTSEYCMSELEKHLRNRQAAHAAAMQNGTSGSLSTSPKPFLQQLLTGELTKDMYMKMERKRFQDGQSQCPH